MKTRFVSGLLMSFFVICCSSIFRDELLFFMSFFDHPLNVRMSKNMFSDKFIKYNSFPSNGMRYLIHVNLVAQTSHFDNKAPSPTGQPKWILKTKKGREGFRTFGYTEQLFLTSSSHISQEFGITTMGEEINFFH